MKKHVLILPVFLVAVVLLLGLSGIAANAGGLVDTTFVFENFDQANSNEITNPYWTLPAGTTFVYYTRPKVGDEGCEINYVWVKDSPTVMIRGLKTREVQDWVYVDEYCDGEPDYLSENTLDWYAQDRAGNLWYMGEYTEEYSCTPPEDPNPGCTSTEGTWNADEEGAEPGIVMLADPTPGAFYEQEYLADEAEDEAKVLQVNARVALTLDNLFEQQKYEDCVKTKEWSPLEIGVIEHKYYCQTTTPDEVPIGLLLLVNELQGGTVRTELVDYYSGSPVEVPGFVLPHNP
jgi:hypothetical protein